MAAAARVFAGPLRYPVPTRLEIAGLTNYVYERDYAVLVRLKVPPNARGTIPIRAEAHWLACTDKICVPEQGELALDLPVGTGTPDRAKFDEWRRLLPRRSRPWPRSSRPATSTASRSRCRAPSPSATLTSSRSTTASSIMPRRRNSSATATAWSRISRASPAIPGNCAACSRSATGAGSSSARSGGRSEAAGLPLGEAAPGAMFWAVLGAMAGGILLNLMPCVFPILALKALHVSKVGESATEARRDALAYTAGAVVGTGALGLALLAIRAGGAEAGWAFQLQDPRTIMLLLLLAVAITANLLGLFELPVLGAEPSPRAASAPARSPRSSPRPAPARSSAPRSGPRCSCRWRDRCWCSPRLAWGSRFPFLMLAFIPALRTRLPKPGPWMQRLQRFLAIPMAASAIAALWLLYRLAGRGALVGALAWSALLLAALIAFGFGQRRGRKVGIAVTAFALMFAILAVFTVARSTSTTVNPSSGAESWSEARVASHVAQGHPAFVYFTADWCLTCKANEAGAIDRDEVRDAFRKAGVEVFAGDWTNGDPAITRFLESRGRAGVPLYLWYAPGKPPEELPQLLTPSMLISRARSVQ